MQYCKNFLRSCKNELSYAWVSRSAFICIKPETGVHYYVSRPGEPLWLSLKSNISAELTSRAFSPSLFDYFLFMTMVVTASGFLLGLLAVIKHDPINLDPTTKTLLSQAQILIFRQRLKLWKRVSCDKLWENSNKRMPLWSFITSPDKTSDAAQYQIGFSKLENFP
ncbi:hypothetical protein VNO77_07728 [Canavalia gladiata]|uniref:Uncharacterized protein n=1 Tax=Canavalia gladiata TaxID=3824 RepID=A0AAN9R0Q6_CANGL